MSVVMWWCLEVFWGVKRVSDYKGSGPEFPKLLVSYNANQIASPKKDINTKEDVGPVVVPM